MHQAVIFDMNGVIVSDELIHHQAWVEFCQIHNFNLTEDEFKQRVAGRTERDILDFLFKKQLSEEEFKKNSSERAKIVGDLYDKSGLELTSGLQEFLQDLKKHHIPTAIATSSRVPMMSYVVDTFGIRQYFDQITTAEEVSHSKPDPEIYLKAAEKLDVDPHDCVAFEDTVSGIQAAKAAGMYVVALTTTHTADELTSADQIIGSFQEVGIEELGLVNYAD